MMLDAKQPLEAANFDFLLMLAQCVHMKLQPSLVLLPLLPLLKHTISTSKLHLNKPIDKNLVDPLN